MFKSGGISGVGNHILTLTGSWILTSPILSDSAKARDNKMKHLTDLLALCTRIILCKSSTAVVLRLEKHFATTD